MQLLPFVGHYVRIVFGSVWGIALVIVGAVSLYERWFDRKPVIPRWVRIWALVAIVVVAQAVAYKQLAENPPVVLRIPAPPASTISEEPPEKKPVTNPGIARTPSTPPKPPIEAKPFVNQSCPNGICAGGDISGNPTINNNFGPLLPQVAWKIDNNTQLPKGVTHPAVWVSISIDRPFLDAKFAVVCDHPCRGVDSRVIAPHGGYIQDQWGKLPDGRPDIAAFVINGPNPMSADDSYMACIESEDENPVKVIAVKTLTIKKPDQ